MIVCIRGKRGRGVPLLITKQKLDALKLVIDSRSLADVHPDNPFVFGIPGTDNAKHLEANRLMNKFACLCGSENPENLKGTQLRKHFATKCGTMQLSSIEFKDIADYMGHEERIHMEHYKLPTAHRDLRISRLLEEASGNVKTPSRELSTPCSSKNTVTTCTSNENAAPMVEYHGQQIISQKQKDGPFKTPSNVKRLSWSEWEKKFVEDKAKFYLENMESPTIDFCSSLINTKPALRKRRLYVLKAFIMNAIKQRKQNIMNSSTKKKINRGPRRFWSDEEKSLVETVFAENFKAKKLPSLSLCTKAIEENTTLRHRTPAVLKAFINNCLKKKTT
ncbi:hypothetical protein WA026_021340 [Henosepilachna vigintioctopunctata]|uniref:Uncharacterized protein n=2 Tax=Henosepilachna vigintioctopunctata TaxID=420089 RepID=A0AAW1UBN0_9CUCU